MQTKVELLAKGSNWGPVQRSSLLFNYQYWLIIFPINLIQNSKGCITELPGRVNFISNMEIDISSMYSINKKLYFLRITAKKLRKSKFKKN